MGSEEILLEASKSNELAAALQMLSETDIDGCPKYAPNICREVCKIIVCRTYATPIMELCHLVHSAAQLDPNGRYEYLFFDSGVARTSSFHTYCAPYRDSAPCLKINSTGIDISYSDGDFSVQYSRMPVLSALMEFCLTTFGYVELDEIFQHVSRPNISKKEISTYANQLSRLIYTYLKEHLPTAQTQRKYRQLLSYCEDDTDTVDDAMILSFWQEASSLQDKTSDFKTFESAFLGYVRLIQAVDAAKDHAALHYSASIGHEREHGEIDPDLLSQSLESVQETISSLLQLQEAPVDQVKFLNKKETALVETLLTAGSQALRLPLSVLRTNIFTKSQSRLTQALRRCAEISDLEGIITEGPEETYQDKQVAYDSLIKHLEQTAYASLYALACAKSQEAISLLLKLHPETNYQALSEQLGQTSQPTDADNVISLHPHRISENFIELLNDEKTLGSELASIMNKAQNSYTALSRKGFKENFQDNTDLQTAFAQGGNLVLDIIHDIEAFLERLDNLSLAGGGWQSQFSYDRTVFSGQFSKIYGQAS